GEHPDRVPPGACDPAAGRAAEALGVRRDRHREHCHISAGPARGPGDRPALARARGASENPPMPRAVAPGRSIVAVVACLVGWAAWFIARTTFVVDGKSYFSLFDDAMISMVYARNFVEGYGLNWARWGNPVEGFTCPLWTFLMIPVNELPLPLRMRSLVVQLL